MVSLRPIDRVLIWFGQWRGTGTIFTHPRPSAIEVDLTTTDAATLYYHHRTWTVRA